MSKWYVIQTKPKKEHDVLRRLNAAGMEVFLPRMRTLTSHKPIFPGYVFLRTDLAQSGRLWLIRYSRGVSKLLGGEEGPQTIADVFIETMKEQTRDGSILEQDLLFGEGDKVHVKRGILQDLRGIILRNLSESGRVKVIFRWMNSRMEALLPYRDLEKAA